jgi:hypothetical protein
MKVSKVCFQPVVAYGYHQECQTVKEIDSIKNDSNRIWIEVVLILERIRVSLNDKRLNKV